MPGSTEALPAGTRERLLQRMIARADRLLCKAEKVSARFTRWRLAIFAVGAIVTVALYHYKWFHLGNGSLVCFFLIFLLVARHHNRLEARMHRLRLWRGIKASHLARIRLEWSGIPFRSLALPDMHPYAVDLDLLGPHSLFHLLDTTTSTNGRARLATWLLNQPPLPQQWLARRGLIQELTRLPLFRDRLALEAALVGESDLDGGRVKAALDSPAGFPALIAVLIIEASLAAATMSLALASVFAGLVEYWSLTLTLYAAIYLLTSSRTGPVFGRALLLHGELNKLQAIFRYLERRATQATPALRRLCSPVLDARNQPSAAMRRLAQVTHALSIRAHPLIHIGMNLLVPWDLFFTHRLERLRRQVFNDLPTWLDTLAEIEAASAIGNFAYLHPSYHWPSLISDDTAGNGRPAAIVAGGLGHPLIAGNKRVTNDLELRGIGRVLLITGSNMSGKSTFLRTIGINACLAQAGAPVCADSFEWTWVRIFCCIRIDDSLEAGLSFFYAEVKRLRRLLDATGNRAAPPVLFLIDEIFKGTNNRERLIGSRAYISALTAGNGFGLITTHDLELAEMEREMPHATNAHFQETVEEMELRFDYKLRSGPCPTTNALRIMALEGLPVGDSTAKPPPCEL